MPAFEVGVDPCWNGWQNIVEGACKGFRSQCGRYQLAYNPGIECIARDTYTAVAKQILRGSTTSAYTGTDMQQGKVAGASAEVADQDELVMVKRGFISIRGRDTAYVSSSSVSAPTKRTGRPTMA